MIQHIDTNAQQCYNISGSGAGNGALLYGGICMDAGFAELVQMATGQGLAVVMCIAFFWQSSQQNTKIIEWMSSIGQQMSQNYTSNEKLLSAMNTLINCVDRLANRIEIWERAMDDNK